MARRRCSDSGCCRLYEGKETAEFQRSLQQFFLSLNRLMKSPLEGPTLLSQVWRGDWCCVRAQLWHVAGWMVPQPGYWPSPCWGNTSRPACRPPCARGVKRSCHPAWCLTVPRDVHFCP